MILHRRSRRGTGSRNLQLGIAVIFAILAAAYFVASAALQPRTGGEGDVAIRVRNRPQLHATPTAAQPTRPATVAPAPRTQAAPTAHKPFTVDASCFVQAGPLGKRVMRELMAQSVAFSKAPDEQCVWFVNSTTLQPLQSDCEESTIERLATDDAIVSRFLAELAGKPPLASSRDVLFLASHTYASSRGSGEDAPAQFALEHTLALRNVKTRFISPSATDIARFLLRRCTGKVPADNMRVVNDEAINLEEPNGAVPEQQSCHFSIADSAIKCDSSGEANRDAFAIRRMTLDLLVQSSELLPLFESGTRWVWRVRCENGRSMDECMATTVEGAAQMLAHPRRPDLVQFVSATDDASPATPIAALRTLFAAGYVWFSPRRDRRWAITFDQASKLIDAPSETHGSEFFVVGDRAAMLTDAVNDTNIALPPTLAPVEPSHIREARLIAACTDPTLPHDFNITLTPYDALPSGIACYRDSDIVCGSASTKGVWEQSLIHAIRHAMKVLSTHATFQATPDSGLPPVPPPIFIDIGGNIGSISLPIARSGFHTHVFEMSPTNMQLLRISACLNNISSKALELHQVALGDVPSRLVKSKDSSESASATTKLICKMYSAKSNVGNLRVVCPNAARPENPLEGDADLVLRGTVELQRPDDVFTLTGVMKHLDAGGYCVVKIDVEGFEPDIMRASTKFLSHLNRPMLIISEVWKTLDKFSEYATLLVQRGYVGLAFSEPSKWLLEVTDFVDFQRTMGVEIDTIAFVQRDFMPHFIETPHQEFVFPPLPVGF